MKYFNYKIYLQKTLKNINIMFFVDFLLDFYIISYKSNRAN